MGIAKEHRHTSAANKFSSSKEELNGVIGGIGGLV